MLVHITREYIDEQKQFNFRQVSFLAPQLLTFEKSLGMVSADSTSVIVLEGKKKVKNYSMSILKIGCLYFLFCF